MTVAASVAPAPYTLRNIEEMLALSRSAVAGLIRAGFVSPAPGPRNEFRFTFQDVVLLRTAHRLQAANIPSRKVLKSLRQLKARLPEQAPLAGLRIRAIGNEVAVRNADAQWEAGTGQLLMDFEVASSEGTVSFLERAPVSDQVAEPATAAAWFDRAERLEADDAAGAEAAYRETLALAPDHESAALNLGAMLCETGRCDEAVKLYDAAIEQSPDAALLHFNRAIALEDRHREREALTAYDTCLRLEPELADAHYNVARLHEKLGEPQAALRHYSAYRRIASKLP